MELRIKEICKEKGITIKSVAELLGITEIALHQQIKGNPTIMTLEKIANVLNVPFTSLFEREEKEHEYINCPYCKKEIRLEAKKETI